MKFVNRIAIIITPRQPMHQWLTTHEFDDIPSLSELSSESSCYLVDEPAQEQPLDELLSQLLQRHGQNIWQSELGVWDEFGDNTPALKDQEQFNLWFDARISGLTFDLAKQPLMVANVNDM